MPGTEAGAQGVANVREAFKYFRAGTLIKFLEDPELEFTDYIAPGPRGDVPLTAITKRREAGVTAPPNRPGYISLHGGGMVTGDRFLAVQTSWIKDFDMVMIAVDYRLAPEFTGLALVEDCYAALVWTGENLAKLGIDPDRLIIGGESAGGGLAASTAMMARDKGGPKICAQMLLCPMLDDRVHNYVSMKQFWEDGLSRGKGCEFMWSLVLGDQMGKEDVSPYIVANRATDLSKLPIAYIDVGTVEPFRDEVMAFASKIWECGGQAELHIWPGGPHGFTTWVPTAEVSKASMASIHNWLHRVLVKRDYA